MVKIIGLWLGTLASLGGVIYNLWPKPEGLTIWFPIGLFFLTIGAKSVLISLWSVSEVTSVRLVKSFQHLKNGKRKLEALSLATEEIRKRGFDRPFFWAGFILVGEAN
jgi:hypothetical protein